MSFSQQQQKLLAIVPKVTGALSAAGDVYIFYDILLDRKKCETSYHRIILGMSVVDFIVSVMFIWSSWAIPADVNPEYGVFQPSGNVHTCNFQGFFITFGIAAPMYNVSLCFYYYAVIVCGWKEFQVRRLEMSMHAFALASGLITAIIALFTKQYNNLMTICWIHGEPFECEYDPTAPCTRGNNAYLMRILLKVIPLWLTQIIATVALAKVFCYVYAQEELASQWRRRWSQHERKKLTREVIWQSVWYLLAFYITWIPASSMQFTYANMIVVHLTMPLQGFLNCLIYVRPSYRRWILKHPRFSVSRKFELCYTFFKQICKVPVDRMENSETQESATDNEMALMDPNVRILSHVGSSVRAIHESENDGHSEELQSNNPTTSHVITPAVHEENMH